MSRTLKSPANLISEYLSNHSVMNGVPVFFGTRPGSPVECLVIYDTEGDPSVRGMRRDEHGALRTSKRKTFPGIQMIARASTPDDSYAILARIVQWSDSVINWGTRLPSGTKLHLKSMVMVSTIMSMGKEDKTNGFLHSVNYRVSIKGF